MSETGAAELGYSEFQPLPQGRAPARPLFAIGDVHGYAEALAVLQRSVLVAAEADYPDMALDLVYLGDYVDRGPQPLETLGLVAQGCGLGRLRETALLGNHDWYLAAAAGLRGATLSGADWVIWLSNGGAETLAGLELGAKLLTGAPNPADVQAALGAEACKLLEGLWLSYRSGGVFCAHAGVDPETPLDQQTEKDLTWIRGAFLHPAEKEAAPWAPGVTVVHGHTPNAFGLFANRIGVDSGGYASGIFSAVEVDPARGVRFHHVRLW